MPHARCFYSGRTLEEHAQADPRVLALQIREARWLRDPKFARAHCRALFDAQFRGREGAFDGQIPVLRVDRRVDRPVSEFAAVAPWELHLVHPDRPFLDALLPAMERNVRGTLEGMDSDRDALPATPTHRRSGLDFQPSFFWFNPSKTDVSRETPLERVEQACFLHAGAAALEAAGVSTGDLAARIRAAVRRKMWVAGRGFYYPIEAGTDRPALVEEIAALYPHAFLLAPFDDPAFDAVFDRLFDPDQLWAPYPALTASRRAEGFSLEEAGRRANGPAWMGANSIVLEALANGVKQYRIGTVSRERFFDVLQRYVRAHYPGGDFSRLRAAEVIHPETGRDMTGAEDAFVSTFADTLIRHVGGLTPRADGVLEFHPIVDAFPYFRFRSLPYRGAILEIVWDAPDGRDRYSDGIEGYTVRRNGTTLFTIPALRHVTWTERDGVREVRER